ncbi:DUF1643 domain-containing protein [Simplicispira suum]|uniref:DUF1643 domain-containing protein n=1 Tax=Simplicispira suum TaxID=2109915 RepID=A0A2S0MXT9_9BURK|nr:DUF1643 domain-containing protein [Simplicispira suum]AVO40702.1 DUF1643 domain-containing protein [Simplicispira suum]
MSFPFVGAPQLRERFLAFAHFYDVHLHGELLPCRSVLEILSLVQAQGFDGAGRGLPNAIFVMMNPGSSRPLAIGNAIEGRSGHSTCRLVATRPDTTQYQIMRIMDRMGWNHVRVINLSDIRESRSSVFMDRYRALEGGHGYRAHSMFSSERRAELTQALKRKKDGPLVLAWGVHPKLTPLIREALPLMQAAGRCFGMLQQGSTDKYFHPLPMLQTDKVRWVRELSAQLQGG